MKAIDRMETAGNNAADLAAENRVPEETASESEDLENESEG